MQTANGMVILSPENHQFKHDVTPAEAMILHNLHKQYANGTPLGDFVINQDEAVTVDAEGKPAEEAYFNQNSGRHVEARPEIPAKTHTRTQAEEIARLKKKYTGNITVDGVAKPAFEATFGTALAVRLPETFEEIAPIVGDHFRKADEESVYADDAKRTLELEKLSRPELTEIALRDHGITCHAADSKSYIVAAIINAENKAALAAQAGDAAPAAETPAEVTPKRKRGAN